MGRRRAGVEARYMTGMFVNDIKSDVVPFDRRYAGSVIVNDGNSRFFEPAPGRTWSAGLSAAMKF